MSSTPYLTAGRLIISLAAISNSISPYLADFNASHVYNPNWPPHARFHNGQTMSMGLLLGLTSLYFTWRPIQSVSIKQSTRDSIWTAALLGSLYWITGLSGALYPGAKFIDPDRVGTKHDAKIFGLPGQAPVFAAHVLLCWVGYALAVQDLAMKVD